MSGLTATKLPPGLPSLQRVQEAAVIRLKEIPIAEDSLRINAPSSKDNEEEWLGLALRELLGVYHLISIWKIDPYHGLTVDLKYISITQVIEYKYEGQLRRFSFHSATPRNAATRSSAAEVTSDLTRQFNKLSVDPAPQLWSVSWDCNVLIHTEDLSGQEDTSHKASLQSVLVTTVLMTEHVPFVGGYRDPRAPTPQRSLFISRRPQQAD